ncbi:MAG: SH3 domain-containing protein [Staphylococcus equorum]|uniref:SH3 domain-containing protein n=1 Tax=Staphylococcus TaxID=1279 RepID=UPI002554B733|nr:SH3 domain-containing protein [Staphylococcus equorum]MDK9870508.1 SH3 domain-containing protein [Staphylococcus equorum]MDK9878262.1 SH3 domain-containing protein [Staphylococcus equorum]MDN6612387.1 SH3 domain-containing protein [Staphylococcus equorum]MDN6721912.1 SH3 domain-containing protein [Staphylococcus equorum]MDN6750555.1 SH3 domain-containing protein [Staphylococcus equorum]
MKKQDGVKWAVKNIGNRLTDGQPYGAQCATFIIEFTKKYWDVHPQGDAKDFINYKWPKGFQVIKGKNQIPQPGDIFVFGGEYGHTGIVTEANGTYFNSIDQNWYNESLTKGSPAAFIEDHDYSNFLGIIRPPYEDADKGASKKSTKIETINHTINYKMANRSGNVKGVVIHNTAGNATAKQDYNNLRNASVARYEAGIAHYYIDRNTVWRAIDTYSVAWHVADANGNNSYIGYEVNESMNASNKDFMANEQAVFKKAAADMLYYGLPVNRDTVMLHNQFVPTACPHRSMAIHTGFDPVRQGAASSNIKNQLKDYFIKEIKKYYNDPSLKAGSPASSDVPDKSTVPSTKPEEEAQTNVGSTGWKKNQHGTWYKPESATFTCGNTAIATRVGSPKLNDDIFGYWFQPSGYTPYDEVCLQDGHVWIGFDWNNTRYYMPIRTWNKVAPPNHGVGQLWGYIS